MDKTFLDVRIFHDGNKSNSGPIDKAFLSHKAETKGVQSENNISGMAQVVELLEVTGSIPGVSHKLRIVWIIIPACLIKQPNSTPSRMYVQTYITVK